MFSEDIITILKSFVPVFSGSVWMQVQILVIGAILCRNERTVASILRVMGLGKETRFINYHRVLNRACWSGLQASRILLGLLIFLVPAPLPIIIGVDETMVSEGMDHFLRCNDLRQTTYLGYQIQQVC